MTTSIKPADGDALIIVDVQNDFLPGGALAVPEGDAVIAPLNRVLDIFHTRGLPIFATRDWHPENHCSFHAQGGPWPPHCVAGSDGAQFPASLALPAFTAIISKATTAEKDAYSGFEDTPLAMQLMMYGTKRVLVGGLATDYCVLNTVKDALKSGFQVVLLTDAARAVNVQPGDGDKALAEMRALGVTEATTKDIQ
jgi:nicotinamidase/pyrazinamidase